MSKIKEYGFHKYAPIREAKRNISSMKKQLVKEIMYRVSPYMWESGFSSKGGSLFLTGFPDSDKSYSLPNGSHTYNFQIYGFTKTKCVITACHMGIMTMDMESLPLEDLIKLHCMVITNRYNMLGQFKSAKESIKNRNQS